jgi:uncharacterized metal-binding protein YceD (DUF177 family)
MSKNREFEIHHAGLALGVHHFEYQLKDSFFEEFADNSFTNAQLDVSLELDKKTSLFILNFTINGTVQTVCDRCGDDFDLKVWDEFEMVAKLTDPEKVAEMNEEDNDVAYFSRTENALDIKALVYEQVILSLPMQIIHPINANGSSTCNTTALALLDKMNQEQKELEQQLNNNNNTNSSLQEQLNKLKLK